MSVINSIKAVSLIGLGSIFGSGSTFLIYIILARELGVEQFGELSSALSIVAVLSIFSGFGIAQAWLKIFGKDGWKAISCIKPSVILLATTIVISIVLLSIWILFGPNSDTTRLTLAVLVFFILGQTGHEFILVKMQLEENYAKMALWQVLPNLLRLFVLTFIFYFLNIYLKSTEVAYVYACIGTLIFILSLANINKMYKGRFKLVGHSLKSTYYPKLTVRHVFTEAWPFALASFFAFIYMQSDLIMIKYLAGDVEAGLYNVAFIIITAIMIFPTVVFSKYLLPKYHRWVNQDKELFLRVYRQSSKFMALAGLVIIIIAFSVSDIAIPFVFGADYRESVFLFNLLVVTIPIVFVSYSVGAVLITKNNIRHKVKIMGGVAVINVVLNSILIPKYFATGAVIATIGSNLILLFLYWITVRNRILIKGF